MLLAHQCTWLLDWLKWTIFGEVIGLCLSLTLTRHSVLQIIFRHPVNGVRIRKHIKFSWFCKTQLFRGTYFWSLLKFNHKNFESSHSGSMMKMIFQKKYTLICFCHSRSLTCDLILIVHISSEWRKTSLLLLYFQRKQPFYTCQWYLGPVSVLILYFVNLQKPWMVQREYDLLNTISVLISTLIICLHACCHVFFLVCHVWYLIWIYFIQPSNFHFPQTTPFGFYSRHGLWILPNDFLFSESMPHSLTTEQHVQLHLNLHHTSLFPYLLLPLPGSF